MMKLVLGARRVPCLYWWSGRALPVHGVHHTYNTHYLHDRASGIFLLPRPNDLIPLAQAEALSQYSTVRFVRRRLEKSQKSTEAKPIKLAVGWLVFWGTECGVVCLRRRRDPEERSVVSGLWTEKRN